MNKVICIGSVSKDIFFPTNQGIILETPEDLKAQRKIAFELGAKYQVQDRFEALGGCTANVARGLSLVGIEVDCYAKIGDDELGQWIKKTLFQGGVGVESLQIEDDCMSDLSIIIVDAESGERTIFSDRDASDRLIVENQAMENAGWLFVSSLNGNWQENLKKIFEFAEERKIRIAFNPGQKNIATDVEAVLNAIGRCGIFLVNKDEALEIILRSNPSATKEEVNDELFLLKTLKAMGPDTVLITDGLRGSWGINDDGIVHAEALIQRAVDTTGSGDAFTGGFFGAYLKSKSLTDSLKWGTINSSNSVLFYGGQEGLMTEEEIISLLDEVRINKIS